MTIKTETVRIVRNTGMKIAGITRNGSREDRFTVLFENGDEVKVSTAQIADFKLYTGSELSGDEYNELRKGLELSSSKARAIRILGSRNLSAREIERRLLSKGESEETARDTVKWLENAGAINDGEYSAMIVRHYSGKGYGIARIRDELYRRGIPRDLWDAALSYIEGEEDAASGFLEKKLKGSCDKDDLRRAADTLHRRGFSYEDARIAIDKYIEARCGTESKNQ